MILPDQVYARMFYSFLLTGKKYREILFVALMKRRLKNLCSRHLARNLEKYVLAYDYSKESFSKEMFNEVFTKEKLESLGMGSLNVALIDAALKEVFANYKGKIKNIRFKMSFKYKGEFDGTFTYYTRNTKNHKKGDVKSVNHKEADKETKKRRVGLCAVLSYLSRYGNDDILDYINKHYDKAKEDKKKFYDLIRHYVDKFGLERLLKAAELKRIHILYVYRHRVEYKSLTFNGFSRKYYIINQNKNKNSKIDAFVTLTWLKDEKTNKNGTLCVR